MRVGKKSPKDWKRYQKKKELVKCNSRKSGIPKQKDEKIKQSPMEYQHGGGLRIVYGQIEENKAKQWTIKIDRYYTNCKFFDRCDPLSRYTSWYLLGLDVYHEKEWNKLIMYLCKPLLTTHIANPSRNWHIVLFVRTKQS